ncbi:MCE family protein [Saccharopolyspora sp. NFXS83]|uniref:MCE family protein n=1 Tax=Saccharopolyspora sp. NFXS83 TaxID=2993560 RepID=UPI00224B2F87|nr:MCE family protein [Saccharopolyspora sp. NFXS83]MCX2730408.1 MCE family protein [Saccharopolyspora sp. NFXS83]
MSIPTAKHPAMTALLAFGCVLVLLFSAGLWWVLRDPGTRITAYFDRAVGLYADSSVRVLGVDVGSVESVRPEGGQVRVEMSVDRGVRIPAEAKAVMVAPSLVSDRYVQLTPAYSAGPQLDSGAVLGKDRTMTPADLDDLYRSANALSQALGPQGANENGALSELLDTTAAGLDGNGAKLNETIRRLGELSGTLSHSQGDLFATVDNLNEFTATLAANDAQVRDFHGRIADVSGFLADERQQTAASLSSLATALTELEAFIRDNREAVSANVDNLAGITQALVDQREALGEVLDIAPTGMSNFVNAYDSASGSVAVRANINELTNPPVLMVCKLLEHSTPAQIPPELRNACGELSGVLDGTLRLPSAGEAVHHLSQGELPPLPLPLTGAMPDAPGTGGPR